MKNFKMITCKEKIMEIFFMLCAFVSILSVALICVFLFQSGIPAIFKIGPVHFLFGRTWMPGNGKYGIFPMIVGSMYVTAGALVIGVPTGILTAVFLVKYCPAWLYRFLKPGINLLAGVPSVVYGFFGLCVLVPWVRNTFQMQFGGNGTSVLTASILLGMMILPTIISVSETSIRAVPEKYYHGSLALGATSERSMYFVVLPAAKSGVLAGVILGIGRAIGETMAVIMVAGNQAMLPANIFQGVRTLTANIVIEMGYATGIHRDALIATGVVLFVFILLINLCFSIVKSKSK